MGTSLTRAGGAGVTEVLAVAEGEVSWLGLAAWDSTGVFIFSLEKLVEPIIKNVYND